MYKSINGRIPNLPFVMVPAGTFTNGKLGIAGLYPAISITVLSWQK